MPPLQKNKNYRNCEEAPRRNCLFGGGFAFWNKLNIQNKSLLNLTAALGTRLAWAAVFVSLVFGLSPFGFIDKTIKALKGGRKSVRLYASVAEPMPASDKYYLGWWNIEKALGAPQLSSKSSLLYFSDENSAFYSGGNYSLVLSGFKMQDTGNQQFKKEQNNLSTSTIKIIDGNKGNFQTSSSSSPIASSTDLIASSTITNSSTTVLDLIFSSASSSLENISTSNDQDNFSASSSTEIDVIDNNVEIKDTIDDTSVEVIEPNQEDQQDNINFQEDNQEDNNKDKEDTENNIIIDDNLDDNLEESAGDINDSDSNDIQNNSFEEIDNATSTETNLEPEKEEVSLWHKILAQAKEIISRPFALAQQEDKKQLEDLGEFQSAKIYLSLATVYRDESANIATSSSPQEKIIIWYALPNNNSTTTENIVSTSSPTDFNIASSTSASSTDRIASSSNYDLVWHKLGSIYAREISNASLGGYLVFDAPFLQGWDDVRNLKIKLSGLAREDEDFIFYLDSIWIEADYDTVNSENKLTASDKFLEKISNKDTFQANEDGELVFKYYKANKGLLNNLGSLLGFSGYWDDIDLQAYLFDNAGNKLDLPLTIIFDDNGQFTVKLPPLPRQFRPGKYQLKIYVDDYSASEPIHLELEQDFSWGVLAINVNKSVYSQEDKEAFISMAVLDDLGHTICDADLVLEIIAPDGTITYLRTQDGSIIKNPECGPDNVIEDPDYYAYYSLVGTGIYQLKLSASTTNGVKEVTDSFEVWPKVDFDVERVGPTRIYPPANYQMTFNIKFNQDYHGDFREYVPADFIIVDQSVEIKNASSGEWILFNSLASSSIVSFTKNIIASDTKELIWHNLNFSAGDEIRISYIFNAPNISPEFYLLGPARIGDFTELRQWQIASDAIVTNDANNGTYVLWTNPTYAWDSTDDTYAYRDIPRKAVDDSGNYLRATANNASNLGGDITAVSIGIEGYVESTLVDAKLVPIFNGVTEGSIYTITGTTLGTADSDITYYVDITNDPNAPTTWTWNDIINLDVKVYGIDYSNASDYYLYIDQIRIQITYTPNTPPESSFNSAILRTDASGIVDLSIEASDADGDDVRAKLEYAAGADCDFTTSGDPTLDTSSSTISADYGTVIIDNNSLYQIGTSTGWIYTASGSNTVQFDWKSLEDLAGVEGIYCLRLTANDIDDDQTIPATTTLMIDNAAPSAPGALSEYSTTKNSITLSFGATSTDLNFREYIIYWKVYDGTDVTESDNMFASTSDPNLADILFNGAATTTITGLAENTTYSFSIWAYDTYGHKSSSTRVDITTNKAPVSKINSANLRTDGSGVIDISMDVGDANLDDCRVKVEYVAGADCNFAAPLDPTLDETQTNIQSTYGIPVIENDNIYQVGTPAGWIPTPATNTVSFDWLSKTDIPAADGIYCLRITANDLSDDQNVPATTTLIIDNKAPLPPGSLSSGGVSSTTVTLLFGSSTIETNFSEYKIFYKQGTSSVSELDTEHIDSNLAYIDYNGATSTTVTGLTPDTYYVFNIWAYDAYGNKASATEIVIKTNASITNDSLTFVNPYINNYAIADGVSEWNFRAVVSESNGWNTIDKVILRLANAQDNSPSFNDLEFQWDQTTNTFTEIGLDSLGMADISANSTSTCSLKTCTIDFKIIFNYKFATSSIDYTAELYSINDLGAQDDDLYTAFYQVKVIRIEQLHYRWRNDDGGE